MDNSSSYLTIDPSQAAQFISTTSQYTPALAVDASDFELAAIIDQSQGYVSKDLGEKNTTTEIAKKDFEYVVQDGETLTTIAQKFDMHVASLVDKNGITVDQIEKIKPGQKLTIPAQDTSDSTTWLSQLNQKKEEARLLALKAEKEKQKKLALAKGRNVVVRSSSSSRDISIISKGGGNRNNGYPYGYCTYYVASQRSVPSQWGNAGQWLSSARNAGYSTGDYPAPGAIMVSNESWIGHVAYVESVNGDSFTISEMNYKGWGVTSTRTLNVNDRAIKGFVY